jgi:hypothetical protein
MASTPESRAAYLKKYRRLNAGQIKERDASRRLVRRYGITLEDKEAIILRQDSICPMCGRKLDTLTEHTAVDHCHTTGKIRGVVHRGCNVAIARLGDDVGAIRRLMRYLLPVELSAWFIRLLDAAETEKPISTKNKSVSIDAPVKDELS